MEMEMESNQECGICIEKIKTRSFVKVCEEAEDEIDKDDPSCVRLKCGHAFHVSCQMPAMRSGVGCSICRDETNKEPLNENVEYFFEVQGDTRQLQQWIQGGTEIIERLADDVSNARNIITREFQINNSLRLKKRALNESVKAHKVICEKLKKDRAKHMRSALREFRQLRKMDFDESKQKVKKALKDLKEEELKSVGGSLGGALQNFFAADDHHDIEFLTSSGSTGGDPARHRFWYR